MLYENEALLAADEYKLTQSRNDLSLSLLALSQALNRTSAEGFDIVAPTFDSLTVESMRHLRNPAEGSPTRWTTDPAYRPSASASSRLSGQYGCPVRLTTPRSH